MDDELPEAKYTASVSSTGEVVITVRAYGREEITSFLRWAKAHLTGDESDERDYRDSHSERNGHRDKRPYMHSGDHCPQCRGHLETKSGRNGPFLGCNGYPACKFTAYISRYPRKGRAQHEV